MGPPLVALGLSHHQLSAREETGYICNFLKAWSQHSKRGCFSTGNCNVSPEPSRSRRWLLRPVPAKGPPQAGPPPCRGGPATVPGLLTGQEPSLGGRQGCPPGQWARGQEGALKPRSQSPCPPSSDPRRCRTVLTQAVWEREADRGHLTPTARPWSLLPSSSHGPPGTPGWAHLHPPVLLGGTAVPTCVGLSHGNAGWSLWPPGPKAGAMGPPRGGAPDTQGRSSHSLGLQTYCPPPTMLSRYLDLRKGVGATNHHHPTPRDACCDLPWALSPRPLTQTRPGGQTPTGWTHPCTACGPLVPGQLAGRGRPLPPQPLPRKNNKPPSAPCGAGPWGTVGPAGSLPELRSPPGPGGCGWAWGWQGPGQQAGTAGQPSRGLWGKWYGQFLL